MAATAIQEKEKIQEIKVKFISLNEFKNKYLNRKDNFKYEWVNGHIEKTPRTMNRDQTLIIQRLQRLFSTTQAYRNMGELVSELDMFLPTANRTSRKRRHSLLETMLSVAANLSSQESAAAKHH